MSKLDWLLAFELRQQVGDNGELSDKIDPELTCTRCNGVLCDVEIDDTLHALVLMAGAHACEPPK